MSGESSQLGSPVSRGNVGDRFERLDTKLDRRVFVSFFASVAIMLSGSRAALSRSPVSIQEFFDYNCSYSRESFSYFQENSNPFSKPIRLRQVNFLILGKDSVFTALGAIVAQWYGAFGLYHRRLMSSDYRHNQDSVISMTSKIGLSAETLVREVESGDAKSILAASIRKGRTHGIKGTPHFVVAGRHVSEFSVSAIDDTVKHAH